MVAIDTNVLIAFFGRDDPAQTQRARALVRETSGSGATLFVNRVVLCEFVWTLASGFKLGRQDICDRLDRLLGAPEFMIEDRSAALRAAKRARSESAGFTDLFFTAVNRDQGCATTVTFDREAARSTDLFTEL